MVKSFDGPNRIDRKQDQQKEDEYELASANHVRFEGRGAEYQVKWDDFDQYKPEIRNREPRLEKQYLLVDAAAVHD